MTSKQSILILQATLPLLALLTFLSAAPAYAQSAAQQDCRRSSRLVYAEAPDLVYDGERDQLFTMVQKWQETCGFSEPALRLTILAAIWDEAFDESIYDISILDALIWRYHDGRNRRVSGQVDPDWAPGGLASPADFAEGIGGFDAFTYDFADQMLPHTADDTLERFFCLFYSGRPDEAWAMLDNGLLGTDLRWYHQRELSILSKPVSRQILTVFGGQFVPAGHATRFGNHVSLGATYGIRQDGFLLRGLLEWRPGRSRYPYLVVKDDVIGYSDRFNNLLLGVEGGREVVSFSRCHLDVFVGLAYDTIRPFKDEDIGLWTLNFMYGAGCRVDLGSRQNWILGFDYRWENPGDRDSKGSDLAGDANTFRISLGVPLGVDPETDPGRRRALLGK